MRKDTCKWKLTTPKSIQANCGSVTRSPLSFSVILLWQLVRWMKGGVLFSCSLPSIMAGEMTSTFVVHSCVSPVGSHSGGLGHRLAFQRRKRSSWADGTVDSAWSCHLVHDTSASSETQYNMAWQSTAILLLSSLQLVCSPTAPFIPGLFLLLDPSCSQVYLGSVVGFPVISVAPTLLQTTSPRVSKPKVSHKLNKVYLLPLSPVTLLLIHIFWKL